MTRASPRLIPSHRAVAYRKDAPRSKAPITEADHAVDARLKRPRGVGAPKMDEAIYQRVSRAIIEHQLPPGTKLGEELLCEIFGVSRPRVRSVLQRLAHDHLVQLYPHRGAFVAQPSVDEAHDIFGARQLFEPALVRQLTPGITEGQLDELRKFVDAERRASEEHDHRMTIRLSGGFHLLLAKFAGNQVVTRFLGELVSRTSLIIALYGLPRATGCSCDHHSRLLSLIGRRDADQAAAFMADHLKEVEANIRLNEPDLSPVDLKKVFLND